ncbi:hypothetical protein EJ06DRAFT_529304 [Trichodelitschia bisporula]|uniref:Uncharacterized protein n=1 Tax=Trichodelitschia bisporula TaxID=703511 RepID=A0A6G1HZ99_9PEZI|nr:hypothetical protein EJ06DRAFT_529304 [Trichodelitschia bisporula]
MLRIQHHPQKKTGAMNPVYPCRPQKTTRPSPCSPVSTHAHTPGMPPPNAPKMPQTNAHSPEHPSPNKP